LLLRDEVTSIHLTNNQGPTLNIEIVAGICLFVLVLQIDEVISIHLTINQGPTLNIEIVAGISLLIIICKLFVRAYEITCNKK
jgi:hypothetical protein